MVPLFLVSLALAGRVERLTELQAEGAHTEVLDTVSKWQASGGLGDEAAVLLALRDRSAFTLAEQAGTVAAFAAFRVNYAGSRLVAAALQKEGRVAFSEAQNEGTSAAMRAFVAAYPASEHVAPAKALEAGLSYQEAVDAGTPDAIAMFMTAHPDSPYTVNAWESLAARTPGIHVRLADGLPRQLDGVPVVDGRVAFPKYAVVAPARPTVAVNLPGTGRGETSPWWGLYAVDAEGNLGAIAPVAALYADAVGAAPDFLLDLVALPGAHAARVAAPPEPLVVPGACTGKARFAYVLVAEERRTAFPFTVDCKAAVPEEAASPLFLAAFAAAERGEDVGATALWDQAAARPAGARLTEWMRTLADDPRETFVRQRPAHGDVLLWDGAATTWWHHGAEGPLALAARPGLYLAGGTGLWTWEPRAEAFAAPAGGACRADSGTRESGTLVDRVGGTRIDVPFVSPRGGTVRVTGAAAGAVTVVEETRGDACAKPPVASGPRVVPLPGGRVAPVPAWAAEKTAAAVGHSVVGEAPWTLFRAFVAGEAGAAPDAGAAPPAPVAPEAAPVAPEAAPAPPVPVAPVAPAPDAAPAPPAPGSPAE